MTHPIEQDNNTMVQPYATRVKRELRDYLEQYMDAHGVEYRGSGKGSFRCPNMAGHSNNDKNYSGSFKTGTDGKMWHCHKCAVGGDIFEMAQFIEGFPSGPVREFWTITVPEVARQVGYDLDEELYDESVNGKNDRSSDVKNFRLNLDDIEKINDIIKDRANPLQMLDGYGRDYPEDIAVKLTEVFGIHFPETDDYDFLPGDHPFRYVNSETGRISGPLRSPFMVIPLHNRYGQLHGFIGRNQNSEILKGGRKYLYTSLIDQSDRIGLFNYHRARRFIAAAGVVYIFESQFDCMTAVASGLDNSISTGTNLDLQFLSTVLTAAGAKEAVIVMDPDSAGVDATMKMYEYLTDREILVTMFKLPKDTDADTYIITNGINDIKSPTKRLTVVEYLLASDYGDLSLPQMSDGGRYISAIGYVVKYSRTVVEATSCSKILAEKFQVKSMDDIHYDITREMNNRKDPLVQRCNQQIENLMYEILNEPDVDKKMSMLDTSIVEVQKGFSSYLTGTKVQAERELDKLLSQGDEEDRGTVFTGIPDMDEVIRLMPGTLFILGGHPSHGKSTFVRGICPLLITKNENTYVIHLSLDDTPQDTMDALIGNIAEIPNDLIESNNIPDRLRHNLENAHETMRSWWGTRYYLYGQSHITGIDDVVNVVRKTEIAHPDAQIILIVDNLMNLSQIADATPKEKRVRVESAINKLHNITQSKGLVTICMVELTKQGSNQPSRPTENMLKETGAIAYRAKIVGLSYIDMKSNENSNINWRPKRSETVLPVLEIEFPKYKKGTPNRRLFLKMDPALDRFYQATAEESHRWRQIVASENKGKSSYNRGNESCGDFDDY